METEVKTTKVCTKCGVEKTFDLFAKGKKNKNGIRGICKKCHCEKEKMRYMRDIVASRAKANARLRAAYNKNIEKARAKRRELYKKNIEKERAKSKKKREENPEKFRKRSLLWRNNNLEKARKMKNKYDDKQISDVGRVYIKKLLHLKGFRKEDITDELINVQQLIIKTKRLCKTSHN